MLIKSVIQATLLSLTLLVSAPGHAAAGDPSVQQVYDMARAGKLDEAQAMMQKVLQDHPNSAKAHFVEAEILAKQGRFASAQAELNNADRLAPGLPFAKPEAVENLRRQINRAPQQRVVSKPSFVQPQAPASGSPPWGLIIVGVGLIAFIMFAVKFMANRNQNTVQYYPQQNGPQGFGSGTPMQPYGGVPGPMGGGGIGSGIVGGLVTGAALGAGMVAGQELMHKFTDGNGRNTNSNENYEPLPPNDMGGNDFGINDSSSWDDGSSSGGGGSDDW